MEAICSSEISVDVQRAIGLYIPDDKVFITTCARTVASNILESRYICTNKLTRAVKVLFCRACL
jgi:hypothetical protein